MSNVLGIISEYNPFHNGHLYHLNESKRVTHSDYSIAIMKPIKLHSENISRFIFNCDVLIFSKGFNFIKII